MRTPALTAKLDAMTENLQELGVLLSGTAREYRRGLRKIIGARFGYSPVLLCDHLCALRSGAGGQDFDSRDYKQLVTDVADKVRIDWKAVIKRGSWSDLSADEIEAAIVRHVDGDKIYVEDKQPQLPDTIAALDDAFSSLSLEWRKLLAAIIYINQVIRPSSNGQGAGDVPAAVEEEPVIEAPAPVPSKAKLVQKRSKENGTGRAAEKQPPARPERKTGDEPLHSKSRALGPTLLDFWRWSTSDLVSGATLELMAEYIVCRALGVANGVRAQSVVSGIVLNSGGLKIRVESACELPATAEAKPPESRFAVRSPRSPEGGASVLNVDLKRRADLYVFCLLTQPGGKTADPLDVSQWEFYVVRSSVLDAKFPLGRTIPLSSLRALEIAPVAFEELPSCIKQQVPPAPARRW